jgi:hypothetical protein
VRRDAIPRGEQLRGVLDDRPQLKHVGLPLSHVTRHTFHGTHDMHVTHVTHGTHVTHVTHVTHSTARTSHTSRTPRTTQRHTRHTRQLATHTEDHAAPRRTLARCRTCGRERWPACACAKRRRPRRYGRPRAVQAQPSKSKSNRYSERPILRPRERTLARYGARHWTCGQQIPSLRRWFSAGWLAPGTQCHLFLG